MTQPFRYFLAGLIVLCGVVPAAAADLVLKRVVMSTGGVGYLEYEAQVTGDAALDLEVPLDQVDDVLKSLVVYDSGGTVGEITLPGREPLTQSFVDLPFGRDALNSAVGLLNALQGAEITVTTPKVISGRLLHVDRETVRSAGAIAETRSRVSVMTDAGLRQFVLQDTDAIRFTDPKLQRQVQTALARIAAYRGADRRRLTLRVHGGATRTVRVGYVVAMPLWKASYRLSLMPDPKAATARLQGWAVLENFTGQAWHDVELTLLSGNPVTFRQALYQSYYVSRPSVPVESGRHVLPPPDTGTVGRVAALHAAKGGRLEKKTMRDARREMAANQAAAKPMSSAEAPAGPPPAPIAAAAAAEEATQIAFTATDKVSVAAGQSLVLPLLDRELPARRVDLYQPSVEGQHPLAAIELTNKGDTGLPPGVLTLYQQNGAQGALYLGDARLAALPAGDKRLLSFAVDSKVTIARSTEQQRPIIEATIAAGVMHVKRMIRWTTSYRVKAATPAAPDLLIEQPRRHGAKLTAPDPKTVELTPRNYRIPLTLPVDGDTTIRVTEDQPIEETIRLVNLNDSRLAALVSSPELDPKVKAALSEVVTRRQAVAHQRNELKRLKEQRRQLVSDEARLRSNLSAVRSDPTLRKRLLDKFTTLEGEIDAVSGAIAKASDALAAAERDLAIYIGKLSL